MARAQFAGVQVEDTVPVGYPALRGCIWYGPTLAFFYNPDFRFRQPMRLIDQGIDPPVCGFDLALDHLLLLRRAGIAFV
jgi:hypothetical protein